MSLVCFGFLTWRPPPPQFSFVGMRERVEVELSKSVDVVEAENAEEVDRDEDEFI